MSRALELFDAVPKLHNCAQAVVCGAGREDLRAPMAACGGGRAPEGRCGALYGAQQLVPEEKRAALAAEFVSTLGSDCCRVLKGELHISCSECVRIGAELAEKYAK